MPDCDCTADANLPRKAGNDGKGRSQPGEKCGEATTGICPESRCRVEAIVPIDARGQMVIPKPLREKAGIRPGDNLVLVAWEKDGKVCCLTLLRSDVIDRTVREFVSP